MKALNWAGVGVRVDPQFKDGPASGFYCGDDSSAKSIVAGILRDFGWEPVDMGGLIEARGLEAFVLTWMAYGRAHGTWNHAFKVVRTG